MTVVTAVTMARSHQILVYIDSLLLTNAADISFQQRPRREETRDIDTSTELETLHYRNQYSAVDTTDTNTLL